MQVLSPSRTAVAYYRVDEEAERKAAAGKSEAREERDGSSSGSAGWGYSAGAGIASEEKGLKPSVVQVVEPEGEAGGVL